MMSLWECTSPSVFMMEESVGLIIESNSQRKLTKLFIIEEVNLAMKDQQILFPKSCGIHLMEEFHKITTPLGKVQDF